MGTLDTASLHSSAREVIRVLRCCLYSSSGGLPGGHAFEVHVPVESPSIILGPNGSGKSLCVAALQLIFGVSQEELRGDLLAAGVERIEVELSAHGQSGRLQMFLQTGERSLQWNPLPDGHNGTPGMPEWLLQRLTERLTNSDQRQRTAKLSAANFLRGGEVSILLDRGLLDDLRELASQPIQSELQDWENRLIALSGEHEEGGRLARERDQLQSVQERIRYAEDLQVKLQQAQQFQADLQVRMVQLTSQLSIVNAEHEEWSKQAAVADRARRIAAWLDEIHRESEEVAWLREQHAQSQERLDELENAFRGAPDNLEAILAEFRDVREAENLLERKLAAAQAEILRMDETIETARRELEESAAPSMEQASSEQQAWQAEIDAAEWELTSLLRARIELIRRREGLQLQLQQEFQLLRELDPAARKTLQSYFDWQDKAEERASQRIRAEEEARLQREHELTRIRIELQTDYPRYAELPGNAGEQVRELFDRRKLLATLNMDAEEFVRRKESLEKRAKASRKAIWIALSGFVGAVVGGLAGGWDIALFSGLVASGLAILILKLFYGNVDRELESVVQAGELIATRSAETTEAIARLESALQPLASLASLDEALRALQSYIELCEKQTLLSAVAARSSAEDEEQSALEQFRLRLPASLIAMPIATAKRQFSGFTALETALSATDNEWREFEENGQKTLRVVQLEQRLAELKQRIRESAAATEQQMRDHEARRRELSERLTVLESVRAVERPPDQRESELTILRERLDQLITESGGFLERLEPEAMAEQLQALSALRTEIRKIRDSLSARQSLDELRARESLLAEELESVKQKLTEMDPLYLLDGTVGDYAAKYSRQLAAAAEAIVATEAEIDTLRRDLETVEIEHWNSLLNECEPRDELVERARACEEEVRRTEHEVHVAKETIDQLCVDLDLNERTHDQTVLNTVTEHLSAFTDGRCRSVQWDTERLSITMADGTTRALSSLSGGLSDAVGIAIRLAILDVAADSLRLPVFWDEPFTRLDDQHLSRVQAAINRLAETRQVTLFTRDSRLGNWGAAAYLHGDRAPAMETIHA